MMEGRRKRRRRSKKAIETIRSFMRIKANILNNVQTHKKLRGYTTLKLTTKHLRTKNSFFLPPIQQYYSPLAPESLSNPSRDFLWLSWCKVCVASSSAARACARALVLTGTNGNAYKISDKNRAKESEASDRGYSFMLNATKALQNCKKFIVTSWEHTELKIISTSFTVICAPMQHVSSTTPPCGFNTPGNSYCKSKNSFLDIL
jgi:hypothetical protein